MRFNKSPPPSCWVALRDTWVSRLALSLTHEPVYLKPRAYTQGCWHSSAAECLPGRQEALSLIASTKQLGIRECILKSPVGKLIPFPCESTHLKALICLQALQEAQALFWDTCLQTRQVHPVVEKVLYTGVYLSHCTSGGGTGSQSSAWVVSWKQTHLNTDLRHFGVSGNPAWALAPPLRILWPTSQSEGGCWRGKKRPTKGSNSISVLRIIFPTFSWGWNVSEGP